MDDTARDPCRSLGRFRPRAFLGRGGAGEVWRVDDPMRPGLSLALKLLKGRIDASTLEEYRLGSVIRHPSIVTTLETGFLPDAGAYLLSEFIPGEPLRPDAERAVWGMEELRRVGLELFGALATIHASGWRHGDLQPRNVLVERGGHGPRTRILDLGLAVELGSENGNRRTAGVPLYLAPEVLRGGEPDERSDLYAAGLLLFECLVSRRAEDVGAHLVATRSGEFHRRVKETEMPAPFAGFLSAVLDPEPRRRLQSASEAIGRLYDVAVDREPPRLVPPTFETARTVGMDALTAALEERLDSLEGGRPSLSVVVIQGDDGFGKSRWVREAVVGATRRGVEARTWAALELELLQRPESREVSAEGVVGLAPSTVADAETDLEAEFLTRRLVEQPLVVGVDSLERLEVPALQRLSSVLERLVTLRTQSASARRSHHHWPLLIVTTRSGEGSGAAAMLRHRFLARLEELPWTASFQLRAWTEVEEEEYLRHALRPRSDLGIARELFRRLAAGVPGRCQEFLRGLAADGCLVLEAGSWRCDIERVPRTYEFSGEREKFLARWQTLPAAAKHFFELAAVYSDGPMGPTLDLAAATAEMSRGEAAEALAELCAGGTLDDFAVKAGGVEAGGVVCLTRRQRVWIRRAMTRARQREHRRAWANSEANESVRAQHRLKLGDSLPLAELEPHLARGDSESLALLRVAVGSRKLEPALRSRCAHVLGERLLRRGDLPQARVFLVFAEAHAQPEERPAIQLALAETASGSGNLEDASQWLALVKEAELPEPLRARCFQSRAVLAFRCGDRRRTIGIVKSALTSYPEYPAYHNLWGNAALLEADLQTAEERFAHALGLARGQGQTLAAADAATNYSRLLMRRGDLEKANELLSEAVDIFAASGLRGQEAIAAGNLGAVLRRRGDYRQAFESFQRSLTIYRELGDDAGVSFILASLGILARELGLAGTAVRRFEAARDAARAGGKSATRRLDRNPIYLCNRALAARDLANDGEATAWRRRYDEIAPALSPHADGDVLLLATRSLAASRDDPTSGSAAGSIASRDNTATSPDFDAIFAARRFEPGDVSWLSVLLDCPALRAWHGAARAALERLADGGAPARLAYELTRIRTHSAKTMSDTSGEMGASGKTGVSREGTRAGPTMSVMHSKTPISERRLLEAALACPLRRLQRDGLVAVLRTASEAEVVASAKRALRRWLDEVLQDVSPEWRPGFRSTTEIKEALELTRTEQEEGASMLGSARSRDILGEVFRFTREILLEGNVDALLRRIVDAAMALTGAERGVLCLRRRSGLEIAISRAEGADLDDPGGQVSRTILERTLADGTARISTNAREDLNLRSVASVEELGLRSVMCVPLLGRSKSALGVLYLDNSFEQGVFNAEQLELVESFCAQAVLAWTAAENRRETERLVAQLHAQHQQTENELAATRREAQRRRSDLSGEFEGIVGTSRRMRELFRWVEVVAPTDIPLLITGGSGSGKELVARALHRHSARADRAFVAENCGAVPSGLLESALFGHVKGAFTGADRDRRGIFELAHRGTLFLDEIAELPLELQARLLRALQEGELRPLGSQRVVRVNVRVIAATNRNMRQEVGAGRFREDLYYRLQGAEVELPALRERVEDVPLLVEHFLAKYGEDGRATKTLSPEALEKLTQYDWPGNVRELENEIRRLALLAPVPTIGAELLSPVVRSGRANVDARCGTNREPGEEPVRSLEVVERAAILNALSHFDGHRRKAAAALGISRSTLYLKLKAMGKA